MDQKSEQKQAALDYLRRRFEASKTEPPTSRINPPVITTPPKSILLAFLLFGASIGAQNLWLRTDDKTSQATEKVLGRPPSQVNIASMLKTEAVWELVKNSNWSVAKTDFSPDGAKWKILGYINPYDTELPESAISSLQTNMTQNIPPIINSSDSSFILARMRVDTLATAANEIIPTLIIGNQGSGASLRTILLGVKKPSASIRNAELYFLYVDPNFLYIDPKNNPSKRFANQEKVAELGREFFTLPEILTFQAGLYLSQGAKGASVILPNGNLTPILPLNPPVESQPLSIQAVFHRPFSRLNPTGVLAERGTLMVYTPEK